MASRPNLRFRCSTGFSTWWRETRIGFVLLPLWANALCVLAEKLDLVKRVGVHEFLLRSGAELSRAKEIQALVRWDMLMGFLIVPCIAVLVAGRLPLLWRHLLVAIYILVSQLVLVAEYLAYVTTGAFASVYGICFGMLWAVHTHDVALRAHDLVRVILVLAFVLFFLALAWRASVKNLRWINKASLIVSAGAILATACFFMPKAAAVPWASSLQVVSAREAFLQNGHTLAFHSEQRLSQSIQTYRSIQSVPERGQTAFTGAAKNSNVILFVMEALSADVIDPSHDELRDMPNMRRLRNRAFLEEKHYTSYPLTALATYSIFTGQYPNDEFSSSVTRIDRPGLIRVLRGNGYASGFYGYVWEYNNDREKLENYGFDRFVPAFVSDPLGRETFYGSLESVKENDYRALNSLRSDIRDWTAHQKKFVAAFFPELSHDPYRISPGCSTRGSRECGRVLAEMQDKWLGELLDELERDHALNSTIIVLTSDHGIRAEAMETDSIAHIPIHCAIDEAMLRVPMLIYAPMALKEPVYIQEPTSHIDISPTMLDLLGISSDRELEQGSPVYSQEVAGRRLFLDMSVFGASGYVSKDVYYSSSHVGFVYKSTDLRAIEKGILPFDGPEANEVRSVIASQKVNQKAYVRLAMARD
jgi:phosphoglycerol transferase MdoB-like AlkP superfamily enzyme